MKFIYFIISFIVLSFIIACRTQKVLQSTAINRESIDTRGNLMLLGKSTKERLKQDPFAIWFNKNYADYKIDSGIADMLRSNLKNKHFVIFMGTWCGDSRREVPKLYRLLDYCRVPASAIQLINLNIHDSVYKQSPGQEEKGLNIHRVPYLLVYAKKEMGRIIEKPVMSWEKDLLTIVKGEKYQSNYPVIDYLQILFQSSEEEEIEKDIVKIADSLKFHISKNEGLQSFGNVLLATNQTGKALIVHRLNTMLYPGDASGLVALGDAYLKSGDSLKAKENYRLVLVLEPRHQKASAMLAKLTK